MHGKFIWNELMTHDLERTKKFYEDTLGWSFEPMKMPDMTYWLIKMSGENVGGIFEMKGPDFAKMPDQWVSYVGVDDVDARFKKALAAGASVMREPFDVPTVGRIAMLREPGGAMVAWMTPNPAQAAAA
jgi:predicted enzyme related to lactoylglutathione lyase